MRPIGEAKRRSFHAAIFAGPKYAVPDGRLGRFSLVTTGHSRSKNARRSLGYDPVVHSEVRLTMDCRIKSGNDDCQSASLQSKPIMH
jgi:hypothetical protein